MISKFRRFLILIFIPIFLCSCRGKHELKYYSDQLGINFSKGKRISYRDTHGGFLGDGFLYLEVKYSDDEVANQIKGHQLFHQMPLTANLNQFAYGPMDSNLIIPEIKTGYYYFYDRCKESTDHYNDELLFERGSLNFTLILFDLEINNLYLVEYDT